MLVLVLVFVFEPLRASRGERERERVRGLRVREQKQTDVRKRRSGDRELVSCAAETTTIVSAFRFQSWMGWNAGPTWPADTQVFSQESC